MLRPFKAIRKVSKTKWSELSTGGKVGKVVLRTVEAALTLAFIGWLIGIILISVVGVMFVTGIGKGVSEGFVLGMDQTFNSHYHNRYYW